MRAYVRMKQLFKSLTIICLFLFTCVHTLLAEDANGVIRGKVVTSDGKPASDVAVILQGTAFNTTTDGAGTFTFHGVPEGSYQVAIYLSGYSNTVKDITVEGNKTLTISLQLEVSSKALSEVVITGTQNRLVKRSSNYVAKLPLANIENPTVYNTITKDLLVNQMIYTVDDATRNAPGIVKMWSATGRSGDGGAYYNSRGFIVQSQLRNGVAGNVTSQIDAANVESIEIIKGPAATLFGSAMTSYGGLMNRVTKKPYDHFGGEIEYAGGSYQFNRLRADINTPLDSAGKVALRLNTAYTTQNTFRDNGYDRSLAFAPSLSYKVNDRLNFLFDAEIYERKGTIDPLFGFTYGVNTGQLSAQRADKLNIDWTRSFFNDDLAETSRSANFFGTMNYKISEQWKSQTVTSITSSYSDGPGPYFSLLPHDSITRADQSTVDSHMGVVEIQQNFIGDFKIGNLRSRFVGGLDLYYQNDNQFFKYTNFDAIPGHGRIDTYSDFNRANLDKAYDAGGYGTYPVYSKAYTYAAYASEVLNITDQLAVQAGLRVDRYDYKGAYDKDSGYVLPGTAYAQTALSPKFGLVYQVIKDKLSVFGNYQNSFRNQFAKAFGQSSILKPEQANQIEGGVKADLFDGKLTGTVSYYDIKVKDVISADPQHAGFYTQTGAAQRSKGFEADVVANPLRGLSILAGFSYNDSKYVDADPTIEGRRPATAGSPMTINFWASYRFNVGKNAGLILGAGGNYADDNKLQNATDAGVFIAPAYTVLNATLAYDTPKFRIGAKLDNITNQKYWLGYESLTLQKLRSFTGSIAFKF
jgi:iron complex outermembrane recepter protein